MTAGGPVVVIGAGLGGLSAAMRLAGAGREVTVVEASDVPGGCCGTATLGSHRFDTGPSVLTMPGVLADTFAAAGQDMERWLPLRRLDPYYRLTFHDGSRLDVVAGADAMAEQVRELSGPEEARRYQRFRRLLGEMFEAEWGAFIDRDMTRLRALARPYALARLAALGGFRRLDGLVRRHLTDERLIRAHTFQALYVGLSPRRALGVYAVIAHMDTVGGVYFPREGGMHAVPRAMAAAAEKAGAVFRYGVRATRIETDGAGVVAVRLATGERLAARHAVVACDLVRAQGRRGGDGLLPEEAADWRLRRPRFSPSCLVAHFALDRRPEGQAHHTLHFGREWESTFAALEAGRPQSDPSLLVTCPVNHGPDNHGPHDHGPGDGGPAVLSVLEPTANTRGGADWTALTPRLLDRMLSRLADLGYGDLSATPRLVLDPPAWRRRGHSAGTPFALDARFTQTAWFRPSGAARRVPGLHFAGMYTAPGVGVPPVLISGRLAAERILESAP
ncbi:phytoene desaturase family protein [Microbispora bryophytorum]|uniref:Phytoene dehydrogenase n=1 Tax=Microbispora bryophytorum TaxID=1460882 RepID=A0A8H9LBP6_9ACTN|nr:phytoene desaturase family protein [Microbispora bryophytorum]MBD3140590.1 phytoene desaturase [Microbispora bryophytorum]TQS01881.1 phytoene desaturase [Microbispora bryophytorum]GGO14775.1 phytoene dehydrogenase [Microbispora bryophytorum]